MYSQFWLLLSTLVLASAEWHLVWQDEFTGNHLNMKHWQYEVGGHGWGNNELQFYTDNRTQNVRLQNGYLVIEALVEPYQGRQFTSGRIHSKQAWTYGRFEARARLPKGHHLWPAIWLFPKEQKYGAWAASGEIDIMEYRGDHTNQIVGTIHYGGSAPNNIQSGSGDKTFADVDFSRDFHIFAVEWDHKEIRWYMNKHEFHKENINRSMWSHKGPNPYHKNGQPFDQPFFWVLNLAVGGNFFGPGPYVTPDQARSWPRHHIEIDYVRVYHWK